MSIETLAGIVIYSPALETALAEELRVGGLATASDTV